MNSTEEILKFKKYVTIVSLSVDRKNYFMEGNPFMRLRNIPGSREVIANSEFVIPEQEMAQMKGRWNEVFGNDRPLRVEIGMGKGQFICRMAALNPQYNFLGIEKYSSVLIRALEKRRSLTDIDNLLFLRMDAEGICDIFAPGEVDRIYLNFSDPWPKDRHAHRRLPGRVFLDRYSRILKEGGRVEFKTDNQDLFSFALEEAAAKGWEIMACTRDLHRDGEMNEGNIMTEYEERFSSVGNSICKVILRPGPQAETIIS